MCEISCYFTQVLPVCPQQGHETMTFSERWWLSTVFWVTPERNSTKGTAGSLDQPPLLMPPCCLFPSLSYSQAKQRATVGLSLCCLRAVRVKMWPPSVLVGGGHPHAGRRWAEDLAEQINVVFPRAMDGAWFFWCSVTVGFMLLCPLVDLEEGPSPLAVCLVLFNF